MIRGQIRELQIHLLVSELFLRGFNHDVKLVSVARNANEARLCNVFEIRLKARDADGQFPLSVVWCAEYSILPRRAQDMNSLCSAVKIYRIRMLTVYSSDEKVHVDDFIPVEMQTHSGIEIKWAHIYGHARTNRKLSCNLYRVLYHLKIYHACIPRRLKGRQAAAADGSRQYAALRGRVSHASNLARETLTLR